MTKIETDKTYETNKLKLYVRGPCNLRACFYFFIFFIIPISVTLYISWLFVFAICWCHVFRQVQKIRFIIVKFFWPNSNQFLVILIRSSELASKFFQSSLFEILKISKHEIKRKSKLRVRRANNKKS